MFGWMTKQLVTRMEGSVGKRLAELKERLDCKEIGTALHSVNL